MRVGRGAMGRSCTLAPKVEGPHALLARKAAPGPSCGLHGLWWLCRWRKIMVDRQCASKERVPPCEKRVSPGRRPYGPSQPPCQACLGLHSASVCVCSHHTQMSAAMLTRSAMRTQVFAARTSARASTRGRRSVCVRATVSAMDGRRAAVVSAEDRGLAVGAPAAALLPASGVNGGSDGNAGPSSGANPARPARAMG